jgi:hypothetical protein
MGAQPRRGRPITIQALLASQREGVPAPCPRCGRDAADHDYDLVDAALRVRIRALEAKLAELEARLAGAAMPPRA